MQFYKYACSYTPILFTNSRSFPDLPNHCQPSPHLHCPLQPPLPPLPAEDIWAIWGGNFIRRLSRGLALLCGHCGWTGKSLVELVLSWHLTAAERVAELLIFWHKAGISLPFSLSPGFVTGLPAAWWDFSIQPFVKWGLHAGSWTPGLDTVLQNTFFFMVFCEGTLHCSTFKIWFCNHWLYNEFWFCACKISPHY